MINQDFTNDTTNCNVFCFYDSESKFCKQCEEYKEAFEIYGRTKQDFEYVLEVINQQLK